MEKFWKLELTSIELTIIQLAVLQYSNNYLDNVFTTKDLESTLNVVNNPNHRAL
jgi:hypothetical protein